MLNAIKLQNMVEVVTLPVFSLQLVLNAPKAAATATTKVAEEIAIKTSSTRSSYLHEKLFDNQANVTRKNVTFTDEQEVMG